MSGFKKEGKTDTKSKSQKHCLKRIRNSSRKSSATIYELQKIMNIEAPLNVHNFKTKPPFDKWSLPYDRGLQNTAFGGK